MVKVYIHFDRHFVCPCILKLRATFSHNAKLHCGLKYVYMSTYIPLSLFHSPTSPYGNPTVHVNPQTGVTYCCRGGKEHHYDRLKLRKKGGGGGSGAHHHHHHHHHHQGHPSSTHTFSSATAPAKTHKVYTIFIFYLHPH